MPDVVIVGAGFGGIGAAINLRRRGVRDFVILERADDIGGTWRDNRYPGCRCDVASNLYSFSFAPNPAWSNTFSYQPEIQQYLQRVVEHFDLRSHIQFNCEMQRATFRDESGDWHLHTSHGDLTSRALILATGSLAEPRLPDIGGLTSFAGEIMHTAQWDPEVELEGKRVGVIGTGASAIQTVPEIAARVKELRVFQRTAPWILPHTGEEVSPEMQQRYQRLPGIQRWQRYNGYWRREALVWGFAKDPRKLTRAETMAREHLERQITDPVLREQLTPHYRLGCKRVLLSNNFYPALTRDNVSLITEGIECVEQRGVRTNDGTLHELDVLIAATGFYVTDNPVGDCVRGRDDRPLADTYRRDLDHYRGTTIPGFPNLFVLAGPNTGLGHSSIIFMIESQLRYVVPAVEHIVQNHSVIEPTDAAAAAWTKALRDKMSNSVWGSGCASWYLNENGVNTTIWPDFTFKFRSATRGFRPDDHRVERVGI